MEGIVHIFEESGLGIAPFTFEHAEWGDWSNCQYCGHDIKEKCFIKDTNGKMFFVGNECVNKTDDTGLINSAKEKLLELRKKMRHEREAKTILRGRVLLHEFPKLLEAVANTSPNPNIYKQTLEGFIRDRMKYGGNKYKIEIAKLVEDTAQHTLTEHELEYVAAHFNAMAMGLEAVIEHEKVVAREKLEAEIAESQAKRAAREKEITAENQFLIDVLTPMAESSTAFFVKDMLNQLKHTELKRLSMRQVEVLAEIYGKTFGEIGSDEYQKAYTEVYNKGLR